MRAENPPHDDKHSEFSAKRRTHPHILDLETGSWLTLDEYLGDADYGTVVNEKRVGIRLAQLDGSERYVCPQCHQPMFLASLKIKNQDTDRFYFKHVHETKDCPGTGGLSAHEICARRFAHAKESPAHKRFKELLVGSMEFDSSFSSIEKEARWVDVDGVRWRQPDVQCIHGSQRVAFEAQLSTTFLHVIAERMRFYARNEGHLLWLFRDLDPTHFRLSEDDVFFANNRNAFRVTEETMKLSREAGRFVLECLWLVPELRNGAVVDTPILKIVSFSDLKFDVSRQGAPRAFAFDYDRARELEERRLDGWKLRQDFEEFWLSDQNDDEQWGHLQKQLRAKGIDAPQWPSDDAARPLLNVLYSVKLWRPVGYSYGSMRDITNYVHDKRKPLFRLYHHALSAYGRINDLKDEDQNQRISERVSKFRKQMMTDHAFDWDGQYAGLVKFLFPEIPKEVVRAISARS